MVLSHLDKIHSDNAVDDIINLLQYTPLDSYEDIFIKCKDFKKNHGKYPDHIYLSNNFFSEILLLKVKSIVMIYIYN